MAVDRSRHRESAGLLMSVIRTLSSSADFTEREKEKSRLEKAYKDSDEKLEKLVSENYNDLNQILQSFTKITDRIDASRQKIHIAKQNLDSCKNLLHCKRDELRKLWLEGVEHKTVVTLLDQIEHLRQVPDKLEGYMSKKHYLHATNLIVSAVSSLEGELAGVEALRDLTQELKIKEEQLHDVLIDELHRQIYIKSTSNVVKVFQRQGSTKIMGKRGIRQVRKPITSVESLKLEHKASSPLSSPPMSPPPDLDLSFPNGVHEDLSSEPEKNQPLFLAILVESLSILKKLPETIEAMKSRIQPELLAIIQRASQQVADNAYQQGETEVLSSQFQPKYLLELINLVFQEFRCVAMAHRMVLNNLNRVVKSDEENSSIILYDMMEVWSKIQAVLELVLSDYLDIRNSASSQQQTPSSFDVPSTDIATYFAKKRPAKPKKMALFRFEASSHAISMNSYLREQRQEFYGSGEILNRVDNISEMGKQLFVCKPGANNVTVIYNPLQKFIKETQAEIGTSHVVPTLQTFISDYVGKIFLGQVIYNITTSINAATKSFDAFSAIVDQKTQKELGMSRPLLQSTVVVWKKINELRELLETLPDYSDNFVDMISKILQDYKDTCLNAYRGIVASDPDEKRVISATWAKDIDIKRFLRSLPNWQNLKEDKESIDQQRANISDEDMRALNSKESFILNGNLASSDNIHPHDIITETTQLRSLANLQESFEWFSSKITTFVADLPTNKETTLNVTQSPEKSLTSVASSSICISDDVIKKLNRIGTEFEDLAEMCLLVLHLEVRVHCFFYLLPVAKQSVYFGPTDDMDPDKEIISLNKDLTNIDEALTQSLLPRKCKYIFEGLGHLIATILINSTQYLKRINENGIKKMTRNIFSIQQNLTSITGCREPDLDHARQYYELMYLKADDILTFVMEQGPQFQELEYINIFQLLQRSQPMSNPKDLEQRLQKLKEILHEKLV